MISSRVLPLHLEIGVGVHALLGHLPLNPLPAFFAPGPEDVLGNPDLGVLHRGVDRGDPEVLLDPLPGGFTQLLGDVGAELLDRVELGSLGGEVVIGLGHLLHPDFLDGHLEVGVLAGQLGRPVLLGEVHVDGDLVPGLGANDLLFEVVDQLAGADLDRVVVGGAALELDPVERADEIDEDVVALLGRTVDHVEASHALTHAVDLAVDDLVRHLGAGLLDLEALVFTEFGVRANADLVLELDRLAFLGRSLGDLDVRRADRNHSRRVNALLVPLGQALLDRLLEDGVVAESLDRQRGRRLALAETGHAHLAGQRPGGPLDLDGHFVGRNFDLDSCPRIF